MQLGITDLTTFLSFTPNQLGMVGSGLSQFEVSEKNLLIRKEKKS